MSKKGNQGTTFKQRLNGNDFALRYAEQLYKKYKAKDILTAGVIALSWLSAEQREKAFDKATGADTDTYCRIKDIKVAISSDPDLSTVRRRQLVKYFELLEDRQQIPGAGHLSDPSDIEKSG